MEGITVEFNQLRKLVHRLKRQCDHVEDDVKTQFTEFLEVGALLRYRKYFTPGQMFINYSN